jgi:hypothetical protein
LLTAQPFDLADSPRELHHTQSPGKQQIPGISKVTPITFSEDFFKIILLDFECLR